jgi:hypothetical protein
VLGEYAENEVRKDFTVSERLAISEEVKRKLEGRVGNPAKMSPEKRENLISHHGDELKGRTDDEAARLAGFGSRRSLRDAGKVVEKGAPALVDAMDSGRVSISAAADVAGLDEAEQIAILAEKNPKAFESLPTNFNPANQTNLSLEPGIDAIMSSLPLEARGNKP